MPSTKPNCSLICKSLTDCADSRPDRATILDRDIRQRSLVPPDKLDECLAVVIGVGAVGRQVALQLAATGVSRMIMFDHDTVEAANLAPQGYFEANIGCSKVVITAELCRRFNSAAKFVGAEDKFTQTYASALDLSHERDPDKKGKIAVFCCVDSIATRKNIWRMVRPGTDFFVDGRMSAETIRILTAAHPKTDAHYEKTLFEEHEAFQGVCTAKSTIYTASIAAGLMVGQFTKWLRNFELEYDLLLNLLSSELLVGDAVG